MEPERTTAQVETALAKQIEKLLSGEVVEEHSEKVVKNWQTRRRHNSGFTTW